MCDVYPDVAKASRPLQFHNLVTRLEPAHALNSKKLTRRYSKQPLSVELLPMHRARMLLSSGSNLNKTKGKPNCRQEEQRNWIKTCTWTASRSPPGTTTGLLDPLGASLDFKSSRLTQNTHGSPTPSGHQPHQQAVPCEGLEFFRALSFKETGRPLSICPGGLEVSSCELPVWVAISTRSITGVVIEKLRCLRLWAWGHLVPRIRVQRFFEFRRGSFNHLKLRVSYDLGFLRVLSSRFRVPSCWGVSALQILLGVKRLSVLCRA